VLAKALANLQEHTRRRGTRLKTLATALTSPGTPAHLRPYLTRMALHAPQSRQQWLWQRLLVQELRRIA